jgi:hypothetical protein
MSDDPTQSISSEAQVALSALSPLQRAFVLNLATSPNATEAAKRAGYAAHSAKVQASRLKADAKIQIAMAALNLRTKQVTEQVTEQIIANVVSAAPALGALTALSERAERLANQATRAGFIVERAAVLEFLYKAMSGEITETRTTKTGEPYEASPPLAARIAAARALCAMEGFDAPTKVQGKVEHEHSGAVSVAREELKSLSTEQIRERLERLRAQAN